MKKSLFVLGISAFLFACTPSTETTTTEEVDTLETLDTTDVEVEVVETEVVSDTTSVE